MTISKTSTTPGGPPIQAPLSHTQNFLALFDKGDGTGPFGPHYNIVVGWRLRGPLDTATLQAAMDDVVARHDALRSEIAGTDGNRFQRIHPPSPARLRVVDLSGVGPADRDVRAEELLGDVEAGSYSVTELPHLEAVLGRFDEADAVLALVVHHTAGDGWSMQVIMRDIAACYAVRRGFASAAPGPVRGYRDHAEAQHAESTAAAPDGDSAGYWREKLRDARILGVRTDHRRSEGLEYISPVHRFAIPAGVGTDALRLARAMHSSPFMLLFAVYNVVLHRLTGADDMVVPTLTSGRADPEFQDTVGPFFNFVPMRTDMAGATAFRNVVERTRANCIEAMSYELPFVQVLAEAPALMEPLAEDGLAACAFQVWQFDSVLDRRTIGDIEYSEVRRRLLPQARGTDVPDGALLTLDLDPSGEIYGNIAYNRNLYEEATMRDLADRYARTLENAVASPDAPLTTL
jgi:hypothetical protein